MTTVEYTEKVNELLKGMGDNAELNGFVVGEDVPIGINMMVLNQTPTLIFCKLDDEGVPTRVVSAISIKDSNTAKIMQIWLGNALSTLNTMQLYGADASIAVSPMIPKEDSENESEEDPQDENEASDCKETE